MDITPNPPTVYETGHQGALGDSLRPNDSALQGWKNLPKATESQAPNQKLQPGENHCGPEGGVVLCPQQWTLPSREQNPPTFLAQGYLLSRPCASFCLSHSPD